MVLESLVATSTTSSRKSLVLVVVVVIEILKPDKQTDRDSLAVTGTSMAARATKAPQQVALSISLNCKPVSQDWYSKQATGYLPSISGLANRVLHTLLKRSFTYPLKRGKQALNLSLSYLV